MRTCQLTLGWDCSKATQKLWTGQATGFGREKPRAPLCQMDVSEMFLLLSAEGAAATLLPGVGGMQ